MRGESGGGSDVALLFFARRRAGFLPRAALLERPNGR